MLYITDMNLVEILILSQSETKGKFNAFHHKGESEGRVHQVCFIKCSVQEDRDGKFWKPMVFLRLSRRGKATEFAAQPWACRTHCHEDLPLQLEDVK